MEYTIKRIETKRLVLRPICLSDAEDLYEYAKDKENIGDIGFKVHESLMESKTIIEEKFLTKPDKKMPETWAIVLKDTDKMIGTIEFHKLNKRTHEAEVGYILNKHYQNQGYMTEALKAVIQFGFKHFNLKTVIAKCRPLNFSSSKVMHKAGMDYYDSLYDVNNQLEKLVYHIDNTKWRN